VTKVKKGIGPIFNYDSRKDAKPLRLKAIKMKIFFPLRENKCHSLINHHRVHRAHREKIKGFSKLLNSFSVFSVVSVVEN
jgi:hypothetical protein